MYWLLLEIASLRGSLPIKIGVLIIPVTGSIGARLFPKLPAVLGTLAYTFCVLGSYIRSLARSGNRITPGATWTGVGKEVWVIGIIAEVEIKKTWLSVRKASPFAPHFMKL